MKPALEKYLVREFVSYSRHQLLVHERGLNIRPPFFEAIDELLLRYLQGIRSPAFVTQELVSIVYQPYLAHLPAIGKGEAPALFKFQQQGGEPRLVILLGHVSHIPGKPEVQQQITAFGQPDEQVFSMAQRSRELVAL